MSTPNPFIDIHNNTISTPIPETDLTPTETGFDPFSSLLATNPNENNDTNTNELKNGQVQLLDLHPAAFDQLTKILTLLQDQGVVSINNSIICQSITRGGTSILKCDVSQISSDLKLHISNPKKFVKIFKQLKTNNNIKVIDDDNEKRFLVIIGDATLHLTKQLDTVIEDSDPPDLSKAEPLGEVVKISKENKETIKVLQSGAEHVDILIKNNNPVGIYFPETGTLSFPGVKETVDKSTADLMLRSCSFLAIDSDEYLVYIGKLDDDYWMVTNCKIGIIDIFIMEKVSSVSDANLLM